MVTMSIVRKPSKKERIKAAASAAFSKAKSKVQHIKRTKKYKTAKAQTKEIAKQAFFLGLAYAKKQLASKPRRKHRKSKKMHRRRR